LADLAALADFEGFDGFGGDAFLMVWLSAVPEPGTEQVGRKANFWLVEGPCQKVGRRTKLTNKQGLECTLLFQGASVGIARAAVLTPDGIHT
jgi:hypothetical protein